MKVGLVLAVALLASVPAHAAPLMTAKDFNLFVLNNATTQGSDTEGRVAVGNDAVFTPYSVGAKVPGTTALVVGHDLTYTNDTFLGDMYVGHNASLTGVGVGNSTYKGNVNAGGSVTYSNGTLVGNIKAGTTVSLNSAGVQGNIAATGTVTVPNNATVTGTITHNPPAFSLPVDFAAEKTRLSTLSTLYSTYKGGSLPSGATLGTVTPDPNPWGHTLTLTGSGSGLVVFNIDASQLNKDWGDFVVNITGGGQALINVSGTSVYWTGGMSVNGSSADSMGSNVLFNFYQATNITFGNIAVLGSVLAPLASYNVNGNYDNRQAGGHIAGQVVMNNWTDTNSSHTQINNVFLRDYAVGKNLLGDPVPPPRQAAVPEPSTWMTMVAGFGLLGGALRRSRRKPALA